MKVVQVNGVDAETLEGFVECLVDILRVAVDGAVGDARPQTKLGREEYIIALSSSLEPVRGQTCNRLETKLVTIPFANKLLAVLVDICRVPELASVLVDTVENLRNTVYEQARTELQL